MLNKLEIPKVIPFEVPIEVLIIEEKKERERELIYEQPFVVVYDEYPDEVPEVNHPKKDRGVREFEL